MGTALDDLFDPYPAHLSVINLAEVLGVTLKTAYEYLQTSQIPCYRIGTRWMILRDEVKEFIGSSARCPAALPVGSKHGVAASEPGQVAAEEPV